jgi:hypothetical protein
MYCCEIVSAWLPSFRFHHRRLVGHLDHGCDFRRIQSEIGDHGLPDRDRHSFRIFGGKTGHFRTDVVGGR